MYYFEIRRLFSSISHIYDDVEEITLKNEMNRQ